MKCLLSVMLVFALVDMSYGLVIFPGQVHTNTSSETFDELIVSGVFLLAKSPPTGGGEPRTVTITNGDFVLASGGAIAQDVYTSIATADGVAGADGTGASGGAGSGAGRGGAGGSGTYPGGNGGNGGDGGAVGGIGGDGGAGGAGGDDIFPGTGGNGGFGGHAGYAGHGPAAFTLTILNDTYGGDVILHGDINLRGGHGGNGGNAGGGGAGGAGGNDPGMGGMGGVGGMGGMGGAGGNGGAGGAVQIIASNGSAAIQNCLNWVDGGWGGMAGNGGAGGAGGPGIVLGMGGDGGHGGNGGPGGNGGTITVLAAKILVDGEQQHTNNTQVMVNHGWGFAGGIAGAGGYPNGRDGYAGSLGSDGANGTAHFMPDAIAPTCSNDPVVLPEAGSAQHGNVLTELAFQSADFGDEMTGAQYLRQSIEVVETNDAYGARLALLTNGMANGIGLQTVAFMPGAWAHKALCFRFITTDAGDNVSTTTWPTTTHYFLVVPEPVLLLPLLLVVSLRLKMLDGRCKVVE